MKQRLNRLVFALILSISWTNPALANTATKASDPKVASVERYIGLLVNPQPRTYRQMIQSLRPFMDGEFLDHMEGKLKSQLEVRFPRYELKSEKEFTYLTVGQGRQKATLQILNSDPEIFARFEGVELTHADMQDPWKMMDKIEKAATGKKALWNVLFIEEARAFNWALFGGLALLGGGLAAGLYFLSRSKVKTEHQVNVNVPENYNVKVEAPTQYNVDVDTNHTLNVPIIDRLINSGGQK